MYGVIAPSVPETPFPFDSVESENEDVLESAEGANARTIHTPEGHRQEENECDPNSGDAEKTKELKK